MTITDDALSAVRGILYAQWNIANPSKTTIGAKNFIVVPKKTVMQGLAVTVRRLRRVDRYVETGANAAQYTDDYIVVEVWTPDKTQKDNMLKEVRRIVKGNRATPPAGIEDMIVTGGVPRDDLTERDPVLGEEVRVRLIYRE